MWIFMNRIKDHLDQNLHNLEAHQLNVKPFHMRPTYPDIFANQLHTQQF